MAPVRLLCRSYERPDSADVHELDQADVHMDVVVALSVQRVGENLLHPADVEGVDCAYEPKSARPQDAQDNQLLIPIGDSSRHSPIPSLPSTLHEATLCRLPNWGLLLMHRTTDPPV